MICGRRFSFITIASIGFLKWFTTDFVHFNACILPSIIRHILLHRGIRGMIRGMVWPWFGHSSLNHNEPAISHAVSRMKMPPVPQYASSLLPYSTRTKIGSIFFNISSETELRLIFFQYCDLPLLITVEDRQSLSSELWEIILACRQLSNGRN